MPSDWGKNLSITGGWRDWTLTSPGCADQPPVGPIRIESGAKGGLYATSHRVVMSRRSAMPTMACSAWAPAASNCPARTISHKNVQLPAKNPSNDQRRLNHAANQSASLRILRGSGRRINRQGCSGRLNALPITRAGCAHAPNGGSAAPGTPNAMVEQPWPHAAFPRIAQAAIERPVPRRMGENQS